MSLRAHGLDMALGILHGEALQVISTMRFTLHRLYNSNICEFCICNFGTLAPQNFTILWCPPRTRNYRGGKPKTSLLQLPPSSCCDLGIQKGSLPPGTWNMPSLSVLTQMEASSSWRSTSSFPRQVALQQKEYQGQFLSEACKNEIWTDSGLWIVTGKGDRKLTAQEPLNSAL